MPVIRSEVFKLAILVLAVPLQIFIATYYGNDSNGRHYELERFISKISKFKTETWKLWNLWLNDLWAVFFKYTPFYRPQDRTQPSSATQSLKTKFMKLVTAKALKENAKKSNNVDESQDEDENSDSNSNEITYLGLSSEVRSPRPPFVKYRVGQVIKHKIGGFRGVIIGWDEKANGPEKLLKQILGENKRYRDQPNYAVLIDGRDRLITDFAYIPQELIEVVTRVHVVHADVDKFFEFHNGNKYTPRPWFRDMYPHD
ncbi:hypothetical protein GQR58_005491 [Nymphon striatum]|nr:hypothetical protein GQR58_005491 [Nymphon striatum]